VYKCIFIELSLSWLKLYQSKEIQKPSSYGDRESSFYLVLVYLRAIRKICGNIESAKTKGFILCPTTKTQCRFPFSSLSLHFSVSLTQNTSIRVSHTKSDRFPSHQYCVFTTVSLKRILRATDETRFPSGMCTNKRIMCNLKNKLLLR